MRMEEFASATRTHATLLRPDSIFLVFTSNSFYSLLESSHLFMTSSVFDQNGSNLENRLEGT